MAGARVIDAAKITFRTEQARCFSAVEQTQILIVGSACHQLDVTLILFEIARLVHDRNLAGHIFHVDPVFVGKGKEICLGLFRHVEQSLGALKAIFRFKVLGPCALAGAELTAIAPRRPIAEPSSVDERDVRALSRQMVGSRKPCISATNDNDIGLPRAIHFRILRPIRDTRFVP